MTIMLWFWLQLGTTFGGKCCWRSIAVARVFALVVVCRIILFVTRFSGYAKTVTPGGSTRDSGAASAAITNLSSGREVFAAQKPSAFTDLLCAAH